MMLKRILMVMLLVVAAHFFWPTSNQLETEPEPAALYPPASQITDATPTVARSFRCDGRQYCSQMTSKAEAEYFLANCPDTKMDGDNDGIPCERQFANEW